METNEFVLREQIALLRGELDTLKTAAGTPTAAEVALAEERRCRQDSDAKLMGYDDRLNAAAYELAAMRAKVDELLVDAARYRYIRSESIIGWCDHTERHDRISFPLIYVEPRKDGENYRDRFDAAIDAARKGGGE